jgi:acetylornithine deacetylase
MNPDVIKLTQDLVAIPSVSHDSNAVVSDLLQNLLDQLGFETERLSYMDEGQEKVSIIAKKGGGEGGLGFFSHSDTVPGDNTWKPFDPVINGDKLYGRGSCDMKGPLASTIVAAASFDVSALKRPIYIGIAADEEVGFGGAIQIVNESNMLQQNCPTYGVIAEPTMMRPVYAHKGGTHVVVTAHGEAAHTSTERGISANFLIAPFLADMAALAPVFKTDPRFLNHEFNPPSFGFNMIMTDHGCKSNVTAAKTTVTLGIRTMPHVQNEEAVEMIVEKAQKYNLSVEVKPGTYFYTSPQNPMVQVSSEMTEGVKPETVPYGTEALVYQKIVPNLVVMGPGDIAQAHTVGEYVLLDQLHYAENVYKKLIQRLCC